MLPFHEWTPCEFNGHVFDDGSCRDCGERTEDAVFELTSEQAEQLERALAQPPRVIPQLLELAKRVMQTQVGVQPS